MYKVIFYQTSFFFSCKATKTLARWPANNINLFTNHFNKLSRNRLTNILSQNSQHAALVDNYAMARVELD